MGRLLAEVLPLALGAAVSPLLFFGAVAVMTGPRPVSRGAAYALGAALPLIAITVVALILGSALSLPQEPAGTKAWIDVGFGIVLFALGLRALRRRPAPDESAAPAKPAASLPRVIATGAGLMVSNVTTIALYIPAMKFISESSASDEDKAVVVAMTLMITLALVLVPLAIVAVAPAASGRVLAAAGGWLSAHRRVLSLVICFGLGAYLLAHGLGRVL